MTAEKIDLRPPGARSSATGEEPSPVEPTDIDALPAIVERARQAQQVWSQKSLRERSRLIHKATLLVLERADEIAQIVSRETGKSTTEVLLNEVSGIAEYAKIAAKEAKVALAPQKVAISSVIYPGKRAIVEAQPRGVVGVIAPWNYPLSIFYKPLFPALLAGNAVIIKPSEHTPGAGAWLAACLQEVLGPELIVAVQGGGEVGAALLESGIDAITFTGSVATGKEVAARAAELLIPCSVELGGKDAAIVLADCDMERTLAGIVQWGLHNCGQNCGAIERIYVEEPIADRFVARLGQLMEQVRVAPDDGFYEMGPLQSLAQRQIVEDHVQDALERGAELVCGGARSSVELGYLPTLLDRCSPAMKVIQEETFGPVMAVIRVKDAEEAIAQANASSFGLNGSIWTSDIARGEALAKRLEVGIACVNNHSFAGSMANIPWTGVGDTGTGIAASRYSFPTFVRRRTLFVDRGKDPDPWWFPFDENSERLAQTLIAFSRGNFLEALNLPGIVKRRVKKIRRWVRRR